MEFQRLWVSIHNLLQGGLVLGCLLGGCKFILSRMEVLQIVLKEI